MADVLLRLRGITHSFHPGTPDEVRALDGVDLDIERGTFTVVLGTNGSGKSSLLNAIAGSLEPAGGEIWLDQHDITRWPDHRRATFVGRVFQDPYAGTAADLTVAENLALANARGRRRGLRPALWREQPRRLRDAVARLGMDLESRLDTPIGLLSGGQRQALTVLMATLAAPRLLLLDEHTAALDPRSAEQVIGLTRAMVRDGELTTLMVTHSLAQAVRSGDRTIVMHHGRVVHDLSGMPRRVLQEADMLQLFDELRWADRLDASAAAMLGRAWV